MICRIKVKEAEQGDRVQREHAIDRTWQSPHHTQAAGAGCFTTGLLDGPLVNRHRPSVDVLFRSSRAECRPERIGYHT